MQPFLDGVHRKKSADMLAFRAETVISKEIRTVMQVSLPGKCCFHAGFLLYCSEEGKGVVV